MGGCPPPPLLLAAMHEGGDAGTLADVDGAHTLWAVELMSRETQEITFSDSTVKGM